jgi:hypothetical protein
MAAAAHHSRIICRLRTAGWPDDGRYPRGRDRFDVSRRDVLGQTLSIERTEQRTVRTADVVVRSTFVTSRPAYSRALPNNTAPFTAPRAMQEDARR